MIETIIIIGTVVVVAAILALLYIVSRNMY